jgi:N-acetylglutamate synthase-like GNAT family acetyltransferase
LSSATIRGRQEDVVTRPQTRCSIRGATPRDLPEVERLLDAAGLPQAGLVDQFGPAYVVAESAAQVVGVAGLEVHGRHGLLRSVAVDPAWRGTGLGRRLVGDRLEAARTARLESVCLLTTTARAYFVALGFAERGRTEAPEAIRSSTEFASACPSEAAFLSLDLAPVRS